MISMNVKDERENLINDICISLGEYHFDLQEIKNLLYVVMDPYEITGRCTDIAELKQDRNDYLLKRFLIAKTVKGCSARTLKVYRDGLTMILRSMGKTVDDITADDIRYYLAVRQKRDKITKTTADNELRYLRSFFQYLVADELVTRNPTAKVDRIKCERRRKEAFTDVEIEKIRLQATGERERAIIETLLSTGCRVSELVGIKMEDIDGNKVLVHGKGAKDRFVYLNAKAMVAIELYISERLDDNPYLFPGGVFEKTFKEWRGKSPGDMVNWWKNPELVDSDKHLDMSTIEAVMRKIARKAGVERANPHKFRRTCATMALRRGMPIEQVSKMLGHEEISTTQIYLDLTEGELEQAHKKYVV